MINQIYYKLINKTSKYYMYQTNNIYISLKDKMKL